MSLCQTCGREHGCDDPDHTKQECEQIIAKLRADLDEAERLLEMARPTMSAGTYHFDNMSAKATQGTKQMSKKIWRGRYQNNEWQPALTKDDQNCTVVEDSANFPVREAMALCKACIAPSGVDGYLTRYYKAEDKYLAAVERLKKKVKVKKKNGKPQGGSTSDPEVARRECGELSYRFLKHGGDDQ